MKIKTAELSGALLDLAVAMAEKRTGIKVFPPNRPTDRGWVEVQYNPDPRVPTARYDPSADWSQGGPIIEREKFQIYPAGNTGWFTSPADGLKQYFGPTPLIAAMRCYVASNLGDEVEVPDALCSR